MKTPIGKKVKAELDLERWLSRLCRAAKEVEKLRRRIKYYERTAIPRQETRHRTGVRAPKQDLWKKSKEKGDVFE